MLNGVPEGKGTMYWNDGDRYIGEWKIDRRVGKGIIILKGEVNILENLRMII